MIPRGLKKHIYPSLLVHSEEEMIKKLIIIKKEFKNPFLHIDVMDGTFTKEKCWAASVSVKKLVGEIPYEVHLMVKKPLNYIEKWRAAGASRVHIHAEIGRNYLSILENIKNSGLQAGLAVNPDTPISSLQLPQGLADAILIMGVQPGKSGKKLLKKTYRKIAETAALARSAQIIVDGGVTLENGPELLKCGADALVSAHALFTSVCARPDTAPLCADIS